VTVAGLATDGTLYTWGSNLHGTLGINSDPTVVTGVSSPVAVVGGLKFAQVSGTSGNGTGNNLMAVTTGGKLYAWGNNSVGNLGDSTIVDKSSPVAVLGGFPIRTNDYIYSQIVPVVPGTSYSITLLSTQPSFGLVQIGNQPATSMTISFEQ
jgi:alpha-tubulin suppressor-like RCC1 family protein